MENLIWPGVFLILGIIAIVVLRKPLGGFIDRTFHIDKSGIKATPQNSRVTDKDEPHTQTFSEFMDIRTSPVVKRQENVIRTNLTKIAANDDAERISMLIRDLAHQQIALQYQKLSYWIFGSQLELLIHVNSVSEGVEESYIREMFEQAKKNEPEYHKATTYESYSGFLFRNNLLFSDNQRIKITDFEIEFLKYLVDSGLTYQRRG